MARSALDEMNKPSRTSRSEKENTYSECDDGVQVKLAPGGADILLQLHFDTVRHRRAAVVCRLTVQSVLLSRKQLLLV